MDIERKLIITLTEQEASALKKVLGGLSDPEFSKLGVSGDDRKSMSELYDLLPYGDDQ